MPHMFLWLENLKAPYPLHIYDSVKSRAQSALFFTLIVVAINTINNFTLDKLPAVSVFALGMFSVLCFNMILIPKLFKNLFVEQSWVVWKHILWILFQFFCIGSFNFLLFVITDLILGRIDYYFYFLATTLTLGIGPVTVWVLYEQNMLLKRNLKEAIQLQEEINKKAPVKADLSEKVEVTPTHPSKPIQFQSNDILFIESADNYVNIHFLVGNDTNYKKVRMTMTKLENQIKKHQYLIRCHRAFIVNINKVIKADGNAQGLKLKLNVGDQTIPVSRKYIQVIRELLSYKG